jgi:hypothetical protein
LGVPEKIFGQFQPRKAKDRAAPEVVVQRSHSEKAGVGLWRLEQLLGWPEKMLEFHTWYLKEKKWIERTDNGGFAITAAGVDEIEKEGMVLGKDPLLPE